MNKNDLHVCEQNFTRKVFRNAKPFMKFSIIKLEVFEIKFKNNFMLKGILVPTFSAVIMQ